MVELIHHIGAGKGQLIGTLFDPSSLVMLVDPGICCPPHATHSNTMAATTAVWYTH